MEPELLSIRDVSLMTGFSARKLWRLCKAGKLPPSHKVEHHRRWTRSSIVAWINNGCRNLTVLEAAKKKFAEKQDDTQPH